MKLFRLFFVLFLIVNFQLFAQTGTVTGTVKDSTNNETIPTSLVILEGTSFKVMTDLDGKFTFKNVPAGTYVITAKFSQFKLYKQTITVKSNENTELTIMLSPNVTVIGPTTVTHTRVKGTQEEVAKDQKENTKVSDGISETAMKAQPAPKASDVLSKVSGASIQDNKFVVVRGLNDRYNAAFLNGAPLPSSESDKKAFTFDIFPSNMLNSLVIYKSGSADQPGEFAGGIIQVNTKTPADSNYQSISIGTSMNTLTTFQNFKDYEGSNLDWLGINNKTRNLSGEIPNSRDFSLLTGAEKGMLAKEMTPSWELKNRMGLPSMNLQLGLNRYYKFKKSEFGFYAAYNYQNTMLTQQTIRREFEESSTGVILRSELIDTNYNQNVMNSAMLNFHFKLNKNHKFNFTNLYSINTDDKVTSRKGVREMDNDPHIYEKANNRWFTQNNLYSGQLEGHHSLFDKYLKIHWIGGYSNVQRDVPNMRRMVYQKTGMTEDDTNSVYTAVIQNNGTIPTAAGNMTWMNTKESIYSMKYNFSIDLTKNRHKDSLNTNETKKDHFKFELKLGGMHQFRDRDFSARNFGFSRYKPSGSSFDNSLLLLPENEIFNEDHLGLMSNGLGGFKLEEATKVSDSYQASSALHAGYIQFDTKFFKKLRVEAGVRVESYNQKFKYVEFGSNLDKHIDTTVVDFLPSASIIYSITKKMQVRGSYARSLSRPEFRELAPFAFYNFAMDNIISGNPDLKRAVIDNYDLRFEIYPGKGQLFTVTGFYKNFTNPIEMIMRPGTSGAPELYYTNIPKVNAYGLELEYRMKLDIFMRDSIDHKFLSKTTFFTNFAIIKSIVDVSQVNGSTYSERPLQGQSPYIVNAGLTYADKGWTASISYNVVGRRIYLVGNSQEPDVWEKERHRIDFQISKEFKNRFEIKFNVRDLLAQTQLFYQDINGNKKYDKGIDSRWQETKFGQTFGLSLSYKF